MRARAGRANSDWGRVPCRRLALHHFSPRYHGDARPESVTLMKRIEGDAVQASRLGQRACRSSDAGSSPTPPWRQPRSPSPGLKSSGPGLTPGASPPGDGSPGDGGLPLARALFCGAGAPEVVAPISAAAL